MYVSSTISIFTLFSSYTLYVTQIWHLGLMNAHKNFQVISLNIERDRVRRDSRRRSRLFSRKTKNSYSSIRSSQASPFSQFVHINILHHPWNLEPHIYTPSSSKNFRRTLFLHSPLRNLEFRTQTHISTHTNTDPQTFLKPCKAIHISSLFSSQEYNTIRCVK